MTLIEMLVGLAVGSLVAAIALTTLVSLGRIHAQGFAVRRNSDTAWLVLAAIAADCRRDGACATHWQVVHGGTLRYRPHGYPQPFAEGIGGLGFIADVETPGGIRRMPLSPGTSCNEALAVTIRLTLHDGRAFERVLRCQ